MTRTTPAAIALVTCLSGPAPAGDFIFGAGHADYAAGRSEDSATLQAEYHFRPFGSLGAFDFSWAVAAEWHDNGSYWLGGGISMVASLGDSPWFVEGSAMPGFYDRDTFRNRLGSDLEFRTLLGVGYRLTGTDALTLSVSHKSNADTGRINPGVDAVSLRWRRSFD